MKVIKLPENGTNFVDYEISGKSIDFGDGEMSFRVDKKERDYRIWPHYVTIRKSTTLEMKRHLRRKVEEYNAGLIEMEVVTATLKSYLGMLDHCDCKEFRKELIDSVVLDRNKVVGEIAYEVENYSEAMVCGL